MVIPFVYGQSLNNLWSLVIRIYYPWFIRFSGLTGKTNWEQAQVEQIADTMDDLRAEVAKWIYEKTEEKKVGTIVN